MKIFRTKLNNFDYKKYEIVCKSEIAPETFLFQLKGRLDFSPGQFIQAKIDHFGEATFAPCSNPRNKEFFELCIRNVGSVSSAFTKLLPGDKIEIRGPYGRGWPFQKIYGCDLLLIAGGMGLVPIRSLILYLEDSKIHLQKIRIFAGFKTPDQVLFQDDLKRWIKKFHADVLAEYADRKFWGEKGLITKPIEAKPINTKRSIAFICGPEIMYSYCVGALLKRGVAENKIYASYERRMECGIGLCQHCSCGKFLVCQDGPVFRYDKIKDEMKK